jgi:hypothetical protein
MPILLIGTGLVFILTGTKGSPSALYAAFQNDFTGPDNYIYWMLSIVTLGAVGYIPDLKNLSRLFIVLVVLMLLLHNGGFFTKLQAFIASNSTPARQGVQAGATVSNPPTAAGTTGVSSTGIGGGAVLQ